jgi:hypothetical protein
VPWATSSLVEMRPGDRRRCPHRHTDRETPHEADGDNVRGCAQQHGDEDDGIPEEDNQEDPERFSD